MNDQSNQIGSGENGMKAAGRRRFVRGVGIATPVILTVASRSALARTCLSPSAQASIALDSSRPDRFKSECSGLSPGYWKNAANPQHPNHGSWTASGAEGMYFSVIFGASGFPGKTLKQVLQLNGSEDPSMLGAHLCAAWCNLQTGKVPSVVLSLQTMKAMWDGRTGSYQPVPGVFWGASQIVEYIKTTFSR
jgi:hypothetical protein